jgi:ribonuclease D
MSFVFIDRPDRLDAVAASLRSGGAIALDCEAAGFHRYSDRLCLIQLTDPSGGDWILDPLAVDVAPLLRDVLEDPSVDVLMHGSDFDLRLLDRDLGIHVRGLVDTQIAASLLGESALGLAALLEKHVDVRLAKKYQRADWAQRPLTQDMLEYAAADTRHLHTLVGRLTAMLEEQGRVEWARQEYARLEQVRWEDDSDVDPVARVRKARRLPPREVSRLRAALEWRDEIARRLDRAAFRVAPDDALIDVAVERPRTLDDLARFKGLNRRLAQAEGAELLRRLDEVDALDEGTLVGFPRRHADGPGRPTPEVEAVAERLKTVRNARADELGLARGTLLSNATLLEIAREHPRSMPQLADVPGIRTWQVEAVGARLLEQLAAK